MNITFSTGKSAYLLLLVLFCSFFASFARAYAQQDTATALIERDEEHRRAVAATMEAATLWILVENEDSLVTGSGFVVADGYVATNAHVVDLDPPFEIYIGNSALPFTEARLVAKAYDKRSSGGSDFALLRFERTADVNLPVLSFNTDIRRMDRVSAWGYPDMVTQWDSSIHTLLDEDYEGDELSPPPVVYTEGTVSTLVKDSAGTFIVHTAAIAAGNSGGPLVNRRGEVVGVNTWGYTEEDEGAFINASLLASDLVAFLRKNGVKPKMADSSPKVIRPTPVP